MYSPETTSRMDTLRSKCANGSITAEELAEGIKLMRDGRAVAASHTPGGKAKKTKAPVNVDAIFADLDKL